LIALSISVLVTSVNPDDNNTIITRESNPIFLLFIMLTPIKFVPKIRKKTEI
jgi:hypothetical protein